MKSFLFSALLAISLGLNALAVIGLVSPKSMAPLTGRLPAQADSAATKSPASQGARTENESENIAARAAAIGPGGTKWADLKSDDPSVFIAHLQAAGFSASEIRALLSHQLNQKVAARRRELTGPAPDTPYWRGTIGLTNVSLTLNPQAQAELREMNLQNARLLESLLGPAPAAPGPTSVIERLQFAGLPGDKVDQLKQINADYADLTNAIQVGASGTYFPEDRAKLKLLNEEKEKDIRALLSQDEYDTYQMRSSITAQSMRNNLQLFHPTEEEFRTIFAFQYAFDQQYNTATGALDPELLRQRTLDQLELTAQIKAALPPERVSDYERSIDPAFKQAVALTSRLELPRENATRLWTLQKDAQQQANAMRGDRALNAEARDRALSALQQDVTARATGILGGTRGFEAYQRNGGGWIQNISSASAATAR